MGRMYSFVITFFLIINLAAQDVDLDQLDRFVEQARQEFEIPGLAIAVVKDDIVVFAKGYGVKNMETGDPVTTSSLFNIASCSKAFTGAAVALLISEGKLDWWDKVIDYIPGFQVADPWVTSQINMTDILTHRTGFGTFYGDLLWYETSYEPLEIIRRMRYLPMTTEFRSEYGYQNNMYMIAGEIIGRITESSWSDFVYQKFFDPLGMNTARTSFIDIIDDQDLAMPHLNRKPQKPYPWQPNGAASIYAGVDDMAKWIRMLLSDGSYDGRQILPPGVVEELFRPHTVKEVSRGMKSRGVHLMAYGLGWNLYDYRNRLIAEHGGGMPGYISRVTLVPEEKLGVVVLTNDDNILPGAVTQHVVDLYTGGVKKDWAAEYLQIRKHIAEWKEKNQKKRHQARLENTRPTLDESEYAGSYLDEMYGEAEITTSEDGLIVTLLPAKHQFTSAMTHWHNDTWHIRFRDEFLPEGFITFYFDSNSQIVGFKIDLPNPDFHFFNLDFKRVGQK